MKDYPHLRAYMAGLLLPSWFLLFVCGAFLLGHFAAVVPAQLDRAVVFPMAIVPNLWGLWNLIYVSLLSRRGVSIGLFGALLPLLLVPAGVALTAALGLNLYTARQALFILPVAMAFYYLAWKYVVSFFNRVVGLR